MPLQLFLVGGFGNPSWCGTRWCQSSIYVPHGPRKTFNWPETEGSCYVPIKNILCQISSPTTTTGWTYKITDEEYDKTISACQYLNMAK